MTFEIDRPLDNTDWEILRHLQADGRIRFAELGRLVSLSAPAVSERVRRMEEGGVIGGYSAVVNPSAVGLAMTAFIRVATTPQTFQKVAELPSTVSEIVDCHRATGNGCFVLKVRVRDVAHLERVLDRIMPLGEPETSVVLSTTAEGRPVTPPELWVHSASQ